MNTNSQIAYESVKPLLPDLREKILTALESIGSGSFRDIAKASGLRDEQVWKRLSELEKAGRVANVNTKLCEISHRPVSVWELAKPH